MKDFSYLQKFSDEINSLIQENKSLGEKNHQLQKELDALHSAGTGIYSGGGNSLNRCLDVNRVR